jgi:hypothetical protein
MPQSTVITDPSGNPRGSKGSEAGQDAKYREAAAKRKADEYRKRKRKSFAWQPPKAAGADPDYDAFDPDKIEAPPSPKPTPTPKLSDLAKK